MGGPDFGQLAPNCLGGYCYVVSPGLRTAQTLAGTFWSFGNGAPAAGQGDDNGSWPVGSWLLPEGSSLWLGGGWSASPGIDGCIAGKVVPGKPAEIMVASISDEANLVGFFAVASARRVLGAYPEFDFTFVAGGGLAQDIDLVEIPRARALSSTRSTILLAGPKLSDVIPGLHGDGSLAPEEVVRGYRVYRKSASPASLRTSDGWSAVTGTVPLGQNSTVIWTPCPPGGRVYFGYTLVFDGGFETAHVGRLAGVFCRYCEDGDGDGFPNILGDPECCPDQEVCDCNDLDAGVHPFALEICNGIDDNCNYVVDDAALPGPVASIALEQQTGTTRLAWPPLPAAQSYDVVRGDLATLLDAGGSYADATRHCVADDVAESHADDPTDPDPGGYGFWYLIRAGNCTGVGSYDGPGASQAAPRDAGIAASGNACP